MGDIIQSIKTKSNNDLEFVIENYNNYSVSELLAVFDEIKERNMMTNDEFEGKKLNIINKKKSINNSNEKLKNVKENSSTDLNSSSLFMFFSYLTFISSDIYFLLSKNDQNNILLLSLLFIFIALMYFVNVYDKQNKTHSLIAKAILAVILLNFIWGSFMNRDLIFIILSLTSSVLGLLIIKTTPKKTSDGGENIKIKTIVKPLDRIQRDYTNQIKHENTEESHYLDDLKFLKNFDFDIK